MKTTTLTLLITTTLQILNITPGDEITSINYFTKELYDTLNLNKKSSIFLIYKEKMGNYQFDQDKKGFKYLFYIDSGHKRRFYVGANVFPNRLLSGKLSISDFVSSEEISKVLVFLELYIDDIYVKDSYDNLVGKFLDSKILPEKFKNCGFKNFDLKDLDFEDVRKGFEDFEIENLEDREKIKKLYDIFYEKLGIRDSGLGEKFVKNDILKKFKEVGKKEREGNLYEMLQSTNFGFPSVKK